jgi:hypothetical protein
MCADSSVLCVSSWEMNSKGKCDADLPSVVRLEGLAFHPDDTDPVCTQNLSAAASLMSCSVLDDEEINDEPETCELADQGGAFCTCFAGSVVSLNTSICFV